MKFGNDKEESQTSQTDFLSNDEENLRERIADLEKKLQDQTDEIVCLRSTLADVLRRVTQLEGRAPVITDNYNSNKFQSQYASNFRYSTAQKLTNSGLQHNNSARCNNGDIGSHRSPTSPLPQAPKSRLSHYPSTGSLHSDGGHSSNSASPVPSPSPSQGSYRGGSPSTRHTPTPSKHISVSTTNLANSKKLSGSQEIGSSMRYSGSPSFSRSLFNLHVRPASPLHMKHGTKDAFHNQEDGTIRIFLKGHPIYVHIPTEYLQEYSLSKVCSAPAQRLKMEWVYGYRGRDCRSNLYLLPTGELVYFIASIVVLYNVEDQIQRHYVGHTDDIKCLAVHPNRLVVATGQVASLDRRERRCRTHVIDSSSPDALFWPHVRIWDSVSLSTLHVIGVGEFERAVSCLAFSKLDGGNYLAVVDDCSEHNISLWEWQKGERGHKITETKSSSETVLAAEFHPMDRHVLITIGRGHIHFWDTEGGTLAKKIGIFDKFDKPKYVLSMAFTDLGELLTGDSNGNIIVWARGSNRVSRVIYNAHDGGIFSLCVMKDGTIVSGGGKDRRICEWDCNLNATGREAKLPENAGGVRMLTQGKGSLLLVGTTRNCILQGTFSLNFSTIVQSHTEEVWALAVHPSQSQFVTGGHDRMIHLWDTMAHSVVWSKDVGEVARSSCFSPDGSVLVVATVTGQCIILDAATRQIYSMHADGNEAIDAVQFSPTGEFLAIGSHDNSVYIYQVSDEFRKYNRVGRCIGHSSYVTHLDWSEDGTYLQTMSGDYELLFWNASVCRQLSNMSIARDIKWNTHTSTLGFNVLGIWPENADGTDVNACDRSHDRKLIATGDDYGKVKLYSYPACQPKSLHHIYSGHSSHVTAVAFLHDDSRLISLGGKDCSIIQWAIV